MLDFDFLVLLEVAAGVFSDVTESITAVPSAIFCTMLLLLLLLVVVVASVGKEDASLVALVSSSSELMVFNVTTMAGVFLMTFRLMYTNDIIRTQFKVDTRILTHQDCPCQAPKCLQLCSTNQYH